MSALEALLEAHVQHELSRFRGRALRQLLDSRAEQTLRWFGEVKLNELITAERVMGVIDRYVIELKVSGGITELVGEMARLVFTSQNSARVRLDQIVSLPTYEGFSEKVVALEDVRRKLVTLLADSTVFGDVGSHVIARGLIEWLLRSNQTGTGRHGPLEPDGSLRARLEQRVIDLLARHLERHRARTMHNAERNLLAAIDSERLRTAADEIWDALSPLTLAQAFAFIGEQDLEDFVILGHEFWLQFRKTPYFRQTLGDAVAFFFRKYGDESVLSVIEDMGVSQTMVKHELSTLLAPMIEHANETGLLASLLRAELASFYRSPAAQAALRSDREPD